MSEYSLEDKDWLDEEWCFVVERTGEYKKGFELFDEGEYDLALNILTKDIKNISDNKMKSTIYTQIGLCYLNRPKLGEWNDTVCDYIRAINFFQKAIDEQDENSEYDNHYNIALAYKEIDEWDQVIKHCQIILDHRDDPKVDSSLIDNAEKASSIAQQKLKNQDMSDDCVIL